MEFLSIYGVLESWELLSANVLETKTLSSFVLLVYALSYHLKKDGCYFVAFSFDEMISHATLIDPLSELQYYLLISCIYCILYWYIEKRKTKLSTIVICGLIVLFNLWMALDAGINIEVETVIYKAHTYIAVTLYLLLIITLLPRQRIRRAMGNYYRLVLAMLRYSDGVTYIWYNCKTHTNQAAKK